MHHKGLDHQLETQGWEKSEEIPEATIKAGPNIQREDEYRYKGISLILRLKYLPKQEIMDMT